MGSSALRLPAARRHALALLLALPLLAACGREAPETLVVERLAEAQVLLVDAASTVGDPASELEVLRTVTLAPDGAGGLLLAPRDVYVRGDTYRTAEDGSRVLAGRLAGLDRSAQAATQPHLTPFWASARVRATDAGDGGDGGEAAAQLELGLLLPDGSLHAPSRAPAEALAQDDDESEDEDAGEPETEPEPTIDDAVPFLLRRVPDAVLALVAAQAGGTWAPGAERRIPVAVGRGRVLPALAGTLVLRRKEGRSWTLDLDVDWRADGPVADRLAWRIVHRVTGFVSVRRDGRLSGGSLASRTRVLDGEEVVGTARHRLQLGETEPTVRGDEAGDLARLLALRAEDETAFLKAVLEQSAASAHALVQRVRPAADLEHVSVFLSDQVEPRSWPSGRHASGASLEEAVSHRARWAPAVKRLLGPRAPEDAPPAPDASDAPDEPDEPDQPDDQTEPDPSSPDGEDWWREGGAAWTHLGVLTAGRGVVSQLDTLAHEYAHFACERFGYPDLARIGFSWDAEQPVWIDLDGLLALAVLEEAQAEATATCATHASFTAAEQRAVIRWYGRMDPRPTAEPDYRKRLYALAYGPSPAVLAAYCELDDDLEAVIARAWATWPYRTQSFLFPRDPVSPSRLWDRARTLADEGAVDGTRVGAFTLLFHLDRRGDATHEANLALVRALADDVLLRAEPDGLLWVTRWADEEAAARFFARVQDVPGTVSRIRGCRVTVRAGRVPKERAWRRHLQADEERGESSPRAAPSAPAEAEPAPATPK